MPPRLPGDCWVCGKPFGSGDHKLDEFGFLVYLECYDAMIAEAFPTSKRNPDFSEMARSLVLLAHPGAQGSIYSIQGIQQERYVRYHAKTEGASNAA